MNASTDREGVTASNNVTANNVADPGRIPKAEFGAGKPRPDCGRFDIRIARDGTWYHEGSPIGRQALVKLFASVLKREPDGFYLETPAERGLIEVEDAPFVIVAVDSEGAGHDRVLTFTTNLGERVVADRDHPITMRNGPDGAGPRPYVLVRHGLEGLVARSVYYELVALADGDCERAEDGDATDERLGLWSHGSYFRLS